MSEERRLVTILFADVVGSTALGESLDPEDLRGLLSRYFAVAREVVADHGGTLEKFIGDAVMAVFGLPSAHGDDPARALAAALELRDRIRADPALRERLPLRIGVNTGEVVATREVSNGEFLITGDAVNTTARLEQAAEPWQILVGERTCRAAGGSFQFETPQGIEAKGKAAPVAARALVGRAEPAGGRRMRLVGRDDDLAQLELVARRAFNEERPYLVSIIAPAGTGKTRLLEEFLERLPGLADASVAITQCLPYGQRLTYAPLRGLLLRIVELEGDPSAEEVRSAAGDWLREAGDADAERSADLLAATLGTGDVEGVDRGALFAAWRSLVERAANRRPLVLVVEDLHWSSDSLLDLIEAILQPRAAAPLLMLVLARPELLDRRPTWGGGRRNYVSLSLEPLHDDSVATLVDDLLGRTAAAVVARVVDRADGNPFYAGEIVRSILERAPGLDETAVDAALASLPDSVQATVLARIDLLEPVARRTLQVGSVFGRAFPVGGLTAVEPALQDPGDGIEQLVERDLVRPARDGGYAFRHILIREVAYGTLPRMERSRLHAAAARYLVDLANGRADELAELIAFHFREAATVGGLLGPVPEDVRESAVRWLRRASDSAMAGAANYEAARHLRAAIDLAGREEMPELYGRLGDVLVAGDEAIDAYAAALAAARELGRPPDQILGLLTSQLLVWTRWHGSVAGGIPDDVERLIADATELLPKTTDRRLHARFNMARAFLPHMHHGETSPAALVDAREAAERALEIAREIDDVDLISGAYDALGSVFLESDDYQADVELSLKRLELDDRLSLAERMDARVVLSWSLATLGRLQESLTWSSAVMTLLGPNQGLSFQLGATAWQINVLHLLGRWDEALALVRRMDETWVDMDRMAAGFALHGWLAALEVARARRNEAMIETLRSTVEEIANRYPDDSRPARLKGMARPDPAALVTDVLEAYSRFTERSDYLDRAMLVCADRLQPVDPSLLRRIVGYMDAHGILVNAAQARRLLGLVTNDPEPLRAALAAFEAMGASPYVARVRADLGHLINDSTLYEAGVAGLEALGDVDQLARLAVRRRA